MAFIIVLVLCLVLKIFVICTTINEIKIRRQRKIYCAQNNIDDDCLPGTCFFVLRRLADVIISGLVCLTILPILFVFLTPLIKLTSKGPVIFKQKRIGIFGKEFVCYKFRSMYVSGDFSMTKMDDARVTPIGLIIRKTHIDEFVQFFNILKGDMSLIGPRPYSNDVVKNRDHFQNWQKRLLVRPGLTGWAQINSPRMMNNQQVLDCDLAYLESMSLKKDIFIFFETLKFKDVSY